MSRFFCFIILVVAVQPVLSRLTGKNVHEIQVQLVNLEKGLTVIPGEEIGNEKANAVNADQKVLVDDAIKTVLISGIAFVKGELEGENHIVVPKGLKDKFQKGSASRYRWSHGFGVAEKKWEYTSPKIVESVEECGDYLKIKQKSLEFTLQAVFGSLDVTFGVVKKGEFYKERSTPTGNDVGVIYTKFSQLKDKWIGKIFTPDFKHKILNDHALLSQMKVKITEFSVKVYTGGEKTLLINAETNVGDLDQTLEDFAIGKASPNTSTPYKIPDFEYALVFKFTLAE